MTRVGGGGGEKPQEMIILFNPTYTAQYCYCFAGGANQNTIRVAQWMLQRKHATTFFGCVGDDKMGKEMRKKAEEVGVRVVYQIDKEEATGIIKTTVGKLIT